MSPGARVGFWAFGEVDVDDRAHGVLEDALEADHGAGGDGGGASGEGDEVLEGVAGVDLVDGGVVDAAGDGDLGAGGGDEEDVSGDEGTSLDLSPRRRRS